MKSVEPRPGTYALVLQVTARESLQIGRLGKLELRRGFYVYVGSASGPGRCAGQAPPPPQACRPGPTGRSTTCVRRPAWWRSGTATTMRSTNTPGPKESDGCASPRHPFGLRIFRLPLPLPPLLSPGTPFEAIALAAHCTALFPEARSFTASTARNVSEHWEQANLGSRPHASRRDIHADFTHPHPR